MGDFNLTKNFIDYWDHVIRLWLDKNADVTLFKDDNAKQQRVVIEAINENSKGNSDYVLNTMHMPEPYWGDPRDCSIVLLDYNPAGGPRLNRHTTINCKDCNKCDNIGMSFIKYVNKPLNSYSTIALRCPVIKEYDDLKWFSDKDNGYEGFNWWQEKRKWLDHLVEAICDKEDEKVNHKLPFGMELCGWHSKKWSNNMDWINNEECSSIIHQRAIQPLFAAMKNSLGNSKLKVAVCIGSEFKPELLSSFFKITIEELDITEEISNKIENGNDIKFEKKNRNIHVIAKTGKGEDSKNRNYRIYRITDGDDAYYILNTHYRGSNSHPGEHFWPFEKLLIEKIKEYDKR